MAIDRAVVYLSCCGDALYIWQRLDFDSSVQSIASLNPRSLQCFSPACFANRNVKTEVPHQCQCNYLISGISTKGTYQVQ